MSEGNFLGMAIEDGKVSVTAAERWKKFGILFAATGAFSGFLPLAPGTWGSILGAGLVWLLKDFSWGWHLTLAVLLLAAGGFICEKACTIFQKADASHINLDEIVGVIVTMIGVPVTGYWLFWGFILFRILDVVKLPPANLFDEKVKNGWGVMLDDVFAGIYANLLLRLMLRATL